MEIDSTLEADRLPDFGDEASLPYVSALVKEVTRWHPVAPTGMRLPTWCIASQAFLISSTTAVPHRLIVDDVYEGYFLPAGSIVIGNSW